MSAKRRGDVSEVPAGTAGEETGAPAGGPRSNEAKSHVESDSAGVYFMSVEDFERRRPPSPRRPRDGDGDER